MPPEVLVCTSLLQPNLFFCKMRFVTVRFLLAIASPMLTMPFHPILLSEMSRTLCMKEKCDCRHNDQ